MEATTAAFVSAFLDRPVFIFGMQAENSTIAQLRTPRSPGLSVYVPDNLAISGATPLLVKWATFNHFQTLSSARPLVSIGNHFCHIFRHSPVPEEWSHPAKITQLLPCKFYLDAEPNEIVLVNVDEPEENLVANAAGINYFHDLRSMHLIAMLNMYRGKSRDDYKQDDLDEAALTLRQKSNSMEHFFQQVASEFKIDTEDLQNYFVTGQVKDSQRINDFEQATQFIVQHDPNHSL